MTRADYLRQVLDQGRPREDALALIKDAARFALQVWEGDEQLVEKVAAVLEGERASGLVIGRPQEVENLARAVLAAISEGSGE